MEFFIAFLVEVFFYQLGFWFMKLVTFGRFSDEKVSLWVSMVGFFVFTIAALSVFFVTRSRV